MCSDHYWGLRSSWHYGEIYCSEVTVALVVRGGHQLSQAASQSVSQSDDSTTHSASCRRSQVGVRRCQQQSGVLCVLVSMVCQVSKLRVDRQYMRPLALNQTVIIQVGRELAQGLLILQGPVLLARSVGVTDGRCACLCARWCAYLPAHV